MKKILITGGTGLIGSDFISSTSKDFLIYSLSRTPNMVDSGNVHYIEHDLTLPHLPSLMPKDIDTIIHLAQSDNFRNFPNGSLSIFNINTYSTLLLLDWAVNNGVRRIIFASTGGLFEFEDRLFNGDKLANSDSMNFYFSSKYCSELLINNYQNDLIIIIARLFFVYGHKQNKNMLIPRLVHNVFNDIPITLSGKDGIKINPIHVSDVSKCLHILTGEESSQHFSIAGEEVLSLREIGEIIGTKLGKSPKFKVDVNNKNKNLLGDIKGLHEKGFVQTIYFNDGISSICEQYSKN